MFMFFFSYSFSLDLIDFPDILHQTLTNGLYFRIDEKKRKTRRRDRTARIIIMFVVVVFFILGMSCGPCLMSFCFIFCFSLERCHGSDSWWWWWCRPVCCALCVCVCTVVAVLAAAVVATGTEFRSAYFPLHSRVSTNKYKPPPLPLFSFSSARLVACNHLRESERTNERVHK